MPWLFLILTAPAISDFVLVTFFGNFDGAMILMAWVTFAGSPVAGIVSAILLVRWQRTDSSSSGILRGIVFSILFLVVAFALCFAGCASAFALSGK